MRQGNGTDLLGTNDPRSATIGVIYVSPNDDRKSVLAAILTQEKLNRQQIVIVLPNPNKAFQRPQDFDDMKSVRQKLQGEVIFIAPDGPGPAEFARQRRFSVYPTLEAYTQAFRANGTGATSAAVAEPPIEKRSRFFGGRGKSAAAGAAAGNLPSDEPQFVDADDELITPAQNTRTPVTNAPQTPRVPNTPRRSTLDDDDDLGPSAGSNIAGAAAGGAAAALAADRLRQASRPAPLAGNLDDEDDLASPDPGDAQDPNATAAGGPGIIDLQPVNPRTAGPVGSPTQNNRPPLRSTAKLNVPPPAPVATPNELEEPDLPPPTHGAKRRRTGSMATGAAAVGAAGALAAAAAGRPAAGPNASAGNAHAASGTPIQRPPAGSPPQRPINPRDRQRRPGWLVVGLLILLLLLLAVAGGICNYMAPSSFQSIVSPISAVLPKPAPDTSATVTVTPDSRVITDNYVMQAVNANPNANQLQVKLHNLNANPTAQTRQVTGTGHTATNPATAHGRITFLNGSFQPFTVGAGTPLLSRAGITIITDEPAQIPAGVPGGANGTMTVRAHAAKAGTIGNIATGSVNRGCCTAGNFIFAHNDTPFTGGVDPQNYNFVQQGDVDAVVTPLVATLSKQAQTDFNKQLATNERLVGAPTCTKTVNTNQDNIGDQGHNITSTSVTVSATCTGIAYDQTGAQKVAQDRLQKKATNDPGAGYALVGNINTQVVNVNRQGQNISLVVSAKGTWAFQVDNAQKSTLAHSLAGKKLADAQAFLNGQKGFKSATIKLSDNSKTMPTDPNQIKIEVQSVPGTPSSPTTNPGGSTTPPVTGPDTTPVVPDGRGSIAPTGSMKG